MSGEKVINAKSLKVGTSPAMQPPAPKARTDKQSNKQESEIDLPSSAHSSSSSRKRNAAHAFDGDLFARPFKRMRVSEPKPQSLPLIVPPGASGALTRLRNQPIVDLQEMLRTFALSAITDGLVCNYGRRQIVYVRFARDDDTVIQLRRKSGFVTLQVTPNDAIEGSDEVAECILASISPNNSFQARLLGLEITVFDKDEDHPTHDVALARPMTIPPNARVSTAVLITATTPVTWRFDRFRDPKNVEKDVLKKKKNGRDRPVTSECNTTTSFAVCCNPAFTRTGAVGYHIQTPTTVPAIVARCFFDGPAGQGRLR